MEEISRLKISNPSETEDDTWIVRPVPGYVCKWKDVKIDGAVGEETRKCFVNVCHCEQLPPPIDDLNEEEVAAQFDSGNVTFRVPIVVGEIECVKDRKEENSIKVIHAGQTKNADLAKINKEVRRSLEKVKGRSLTKKKRALALKSSPFTNLERPDGSTTYNRPEIRKLVLTHFSNLYEATTREPRSRYGSGTFRNFL
uniref:PIH1 domain-containing protein n=2 Tax=Caenorhabditis japonica TaxID=281687 RepID=A0A8R1IPJ7_CAEJA